MALGTNNGNQQKEYNPTVYSRYQFSNPKGAYEQSKIEFSHWAGLLKVSIYPLVPGSENEYNRKGGVSLHLSVPVAYILLEEIKKYQQDLAEGRNVDFFYGSNTNKGLIGLYTGEYFGYPGRLFLVIFRLDEQGNVLSNYGYELKNQGHYFGVRNFREDTKEFVNVSYDNVELELIKIHLQQYIEAMTMSQGYAAIEAGKINSNNVHSSLQQIKQHLGIKVERKTSGANDFFRGTNDTPKTAYDSISEAIGNESPIQDDDNIEFDL